MRVYFLTDDALPVVFLHDATKNAPRAALQREEASFIDFELSLFFSFLSYLSIFARLTFAYPKRNRRRTDTQERPLYCPCSSLTGFLYLERAPKKRNKWAVPPSRYWAKEDGSQYEVSILHFPFLLEPRFLTESRVCLQCMLYASPFWRLCAHCGVFPRPEEKGKREGDCLSSLSPLRSRHILFPFSTGSACSVISRCDAVYMEGEAHEEFTLLDVMWKGNGVVIPQ